MKMTRQEVATHLESPSTENVRSERSSHIDHSWERMNTGLMTNGAEFHPADHRLHKVLRHQSAHRSACPENVSKWSASIGMTYSDLGYCFFFFRAGFFSLSVLWWVSWKTDPADSHWCRTEVLSVMQQSLASHVLFLTECLPRSFWKIPLTLQYFGTIPRRINRACFVRSKSRESPWDEVIFFLLPSIPLFFALSLFSHTRCFDWLSEPFCGTSSYLSNSPQIWGIYSNAHSGRRRSFF